MSKRLIISNLMILVIVLISLPISHAQLSAQGSFIKFSAYRDDPFVQEPRVGRMKASNFDLYEGHRVLFNSRALIQDEAVVYRENAEGEFIPFAFNPWPPLPTANKKGNFKFQNEARFPLLDILRGPDGKPILKDGLQTWNPIDCYLGMTTTFKAVNDGKDAAEFWAGRDINWGNLHNNNYVMFINSHSFIDFNAFYAPLAKQLFFGVVPYRLPGETAVKIFETATSWEMAAHEGGHALHHALKTNMDLSNPGPRVWSESFADQVAMWTSLRDIDRARTLLREVESDLAKSNSLTRLAEAFAAIVGEGNGVRDAFHEKKVSDTSEEVHDRSEVLTGAAYNFFVTVNSRLRNHTGMSEIDSLQKAGEILGTFVIRSADYTPENIITLEDVGKAYLKVDKEFYNSQYHDFLVSEFFKREIFDDSSQAEWMEHDAGVPDLQLPSGASNQEIEQLIEANLDKLGIGSEFGIKLQSVIRDRRFKQTIVRVQLTDGTGSNAELFNNHGILVFRKDGTLSDYFPPIPENGGLHSHMQTQAKARALLGKAKQLHLDKHAVPLSIVRRPDGQLTVEARVMQNTGFFCWVKAFTLENHEGERREIIIPILPRKLKGLQPSGVEILTVDDLKD